MRTEHDLDEMLAEHHRRFDPEHRPDLPPAEPEPRPPRTTWPRGRQWANWPASAQAEFALWVRRLYHEQRLPAVEVAATLNVTARNVAAEAKRQGLWRQAIPAEERRPQIKALYEAHRGEVSATDIARMLGVAVSTVNYDMQALGLTTQRDRTMAEAARRRARVKAIHAEHGGNITAVQIAGLLGVGDTTVVKDLHHLGLVRPPRKDVERMERTVDRALASMGDMAQLILDQEHLEHLEPDADRLTQWVSTIRRVSKAINSVRRHAKGESHG